MLRKGDVLMEFDGIPIANDGTVPFRARERIFFTAFTTLKPTGSTARVKVCQGCRRKCESSRCVEQHTGRAMVQCGNTHALLQATQSTVFSS